MKRSELSRKAKPNPELRASRIEVMERSKGFCEAQTDICAHIARHAHHKKRRSQGGSDSPDNLLALCESCHNWIHANPEESFRRGWLVRMGS